MKFLCRLLGHKKIPIENKPFLQVINLSYCQRCGDITPTISKQPCQFLVCVPPSIGQVGGIHREEIKEVLH
jgi:hypothetical protein